jgi:hypothetical protein
MALASATGVSGGAAATIPLTFFKIDFPGSLQYSAREKQQSDEKVGTVDCYVFSSEPRPGAKRILWIGKQDFLVHQIKTVTSPESLQTAIDQASSITGDHSQTKSQVTTPITSIETHINIVLNKQFSELDFER